MNSKVKVLHRLSVLLQFYKLAVLEGGSRLLKPSWVVYGRAVLSQNYAKIGLKYRFFESSVCNCAVSCKGYVALVRDGWVNECVTPTWDSQSTLRKTFHCHLVQHRSHVDWPGVEPTSMIMKSILCLHAVLCICGSYSYIYSCFGGI